jgi:hypothetical protein
MCYERTIKLNMNDSKNINTQVDIGLLRLIMKAISVSKVVKRLEIPSQVEIAVDTGNVVYNPTWVMYQTAPLNEIKNYEGKISGQPSKEFYQFVVDQVNSYIFEDKEPPADIAAAIKNIADDHLSDRMPVIRAGDYISLQNHLRNMRAQ